VLPLTLISLAPGDGIRRLSFHRLLSGAVHSTVTTFSLRFVQEMHETIRVIHVFCFPSLKMCLASSKLTLCCHWCTAPVLPMSPCYDTTGQFTPRPTTPPAVCLLTLPSHCESLFNFQLLPSQGRGNHCYRLPHKSDDKSRS
jgi:hypothetical protein